MKVDNGSSHVKQNISHSLKEKSDCSCSNKFQKLRSYERAVWRYFKSRKSEPSGISMDEFYEYFKKLSNDITVYKMIYKKGDASNVDNYRGITLVSCMSKLFTSILNKRITVLCEYLKFAKFNIISDAQFGFRKGRSTVDVVFVLMSVIQTFMFTCSFCWPYEVLRYD